jgi:hypothetical protein
MAGFDDFTDDPPAAVVTGFWQAIDRDRYPLSPRMRPFRTALAKLDPALVKPAIERSPLPEAPARSRGDRGGETIALARAGDLFRLIRFSRNIETRALIGMGHVAARN